MSFRRYRTYLLVPAAFIEKKMWFSWPIVSIYMYMYFLLFFFLSRPMMCGRDFSRGFCFSGPVTFIFCFFYFNLFSIYFFLSASIAFCFFFLFLFFSIRRAGKGPPISKCSSTIDKKNSGRYRSPRWAIKPFFLHLRQIFLIINSLLKPQRRPSFCFCFSCGTHDGNASICACVSVERPL